MKRVLIAICVALMVVLGIIILLVISYLIERYWHIKQSYSALFAVFVITAFDVYKKLKK